jgi:hypothetical protein
MILPLVMACSSTHPRSTASPSTIATTTTTTQAQLEAVILGQWRAAQQASLAAAKDPGSQGLTTVLADYFVDPALTSLRSTYSAYVRDGLTSIGDIDPGSPSIIRISGTMAEVQSCATNRLALVYAATGTPLPGPVGSTNPVLNGVRTTMLRTPSNVWKISANTVKDGSCNGI